MNESYPSPTELNEDPELAALRILKTSLDVAERALTASYPYSCDSDRCFSEQEAYAFSILLQIDALNTVLSEYTDSIRRLRELRRQDLPGDNIPF